MEAREQADDLARRKMSYSGRAEFAHTIDTMIGKHNSEYKYSTL